MFTYLVKSGIDITLRATEVLAVAGCGRLKLRYPGVYIGIPAKCDKNRVIVGKDANNRCIYISLGIIVIMVLFLSKLHGTYK